MKYQDRGLAKNHFSHAFSSEINELKAVNKLGIRLLDELSDAERGELTLQILGCFSNYLLKYTNLVKYGRIDLRQKDSYIFLALFASGQGGNGKSKKEVFKTIARRMPVAFFNWDIEDVYGEMVVLLLEVMSKYKNKEVGFTYYLQTFFRYALKQWVTHHWNDATIYEYSKSSDNTRDLFSNFDNSEILHLIPKSMWDMSYLDGFGLEIHDTSDEWIFFCSALPFKNMSLTQRQILHMRYNQGLNFSQIEEAIGIKRKELKLEICYLVEQLTNYYNELMILSC